MENRYIIISHILIASLTAIGLYISLKPLLVVEQSLLVADVVISGILLSALLFLLRNIVIYNHFSALAWRQRLINYSALAILFTVCWIGAEYLMLYFIYQNDEWKALTPSLQLRIMISLLIYCISALAYSGLQKQEDPNTESITDNFDETERPYPQTEITDNNSIEAEPQEILERIAVKNGQKIEVIPIAEILHLQAEGDYVMIHSVKGKFLKEQTMKSFEAALPAEKFVRVHRSSIINIEFIAQIELFDKQSQLLKLKNGTQVKISLNGYKALKKTLGL